jgi:adenylate cyclase
MAEERVQRRLAAILAADVAGYGRLVREDEEGTLAAVKSDIAAAFEPKVAAHNGRIFKTMGDGLLAEFASVVDAVRCAVGVQRAMADRNAARADDRRIEFRIGINLGDVVAEGDDLHGDGVNVSARLEGLADPGGIFISGTAFDHVQKNIDVGYEFLGEQKVKNIADPVRVYRLLTGSDNAGKLIDATRKSTGAWKWPAITASGVVLVALAGGVALLPPWQSTVEPASVERTAFPLPDKPSIAVLPFDNLSGDSKQDYFADGLTEDLITNLSLYRELFVIARNSTFAYRNKAVDVKQVGRELGVAFVVEGSVRREDGRVRVNAQLIDARTGSHVWAERFDRELTDIFGIQDEITRTIAGRLAPEVAKARVEQTRDEPTSDLGAWDLYLQAKAAQASYTKEMQEEAVRLAAMAIARDPGFAGPFAVVARARGTQFFYQWTDSPESTLADAIGKAQEAIRLDGGDAAAYAALGYVYRLTGDDTRSIANLERAAKLNPNDANVRLELAHTLDWFRRQDRALPEIIEAIRLSPRDPRLQMMFFYKSHILFHLGDHEASLRAAKEMSSALTTDTWRTRYHLIRAANFAQLERGAEAEAEIRDARELVPKLSLATLRRRFEGSHTTITPTIANFGWSL